MRGSCRWSPGLLPPAPSPVLQRSLSGQGWGDGQLALAQRLLLPQPRPCIQNAHITHLTDGVRMLLDVKKRKPGQGLWPGTEVGKDFGGRGSTGGWGLGLRLFSRLAVGSRGCAGRSMAREVEAFPWPDPNPGPPSVSGAGTTAWGWWLVLPPAAGGLVLATTERQQGLPEVPRGVALNGLVEGLVVFLDEFLPDVE